MTKLQSIVAEIEALPASERHELFSMVLRLDGPMREAHVFTDEEWAEIDDVLKNDTGLFTVDEVFDSLKEKHAPVTTTD
jgi:hypothetical protein